MKIHPEQKYCNDNRYNTKDTNYCSSRRTYSKRNNMLAHLVLKIYVPARYHSIVLSNSDTFG